MKFDSVSRKQWVISSAAAVAAMILVISMTSKLGIGISPDSARYISIAENIVAGNGYAIYDLELLKTKLDEQEIVYLDWFRNIDRRFLYEPEELSSSVEVTLISEKSDGALYQVRKKPTGTDG